MSTTVLTTALKTAIALAVVSIGRGIAVLTTHYGTYVLTAIISQLSQRVAGI